MFKYYYKDLMICYNENISNNIVKPIVVLERKQNMNLYNILTTENVVDSINENFDYLIELIPEIKYMVGFEHNHPHHHLDVWNHTLLALSMAQNSFNVRLVLLLHDIGKPFSYQEKDGIRHFKNHSRVSAIMSRDILNRLNYSEEYINKICFYVENHDFPITDKLIENNYNDALLLFEVQKCDALAHPPDKLEKRKKYINEINGKLVLR